MKTKILAIDFVLQNKDVTAGDFYIANSFSDYDVLVIDPEETAQKWEDKIKPLSDGTLQTIFTNDHGFGKSLLTTMKSRKREVELLLNVTGGIVICFVKQRGIHLDLYKSTPHFSDLVGEIDRYSWLPVNLKLSNCIGQEIGEINMHHPFSSYFTVLKDYIRFEATISPGESDQFIAKNKVGEIIATEVPFGQGKFIFLPPPTTSVEWNNLTSVLLDCIYKSIGWNISLAEPSWITEYKVPGELDVRKEIEGIEVKTNKLTLELETSQKKLRSLEMIRSLLYGQGKYVLEPAIRSAFRILGFNVLEPQEYDGNYDLYIIDDDLLIIGEIEGTAGQVDVKKYRQLLDYIENESQQGKNCKGILIANAYKDIKPDERDEQFTSEAISGTRRQKFCRMTTFELFKAVWCVLENEGKENVKQTIKQLILNCEDSFKFR